MTAGCVPVVEGYGLMDDRGVFTRSKRIEFRSEPLPKTRLGKILRRQLRDEIALRRPAREVALAG